MISVFLFSSNVLSKIQHFNECNGFRHSSGMAPSITITPADLASALKARNIRIEDYDDDSDDDSINWKDYYGDDENGKYYFVSTLIFFFSYFFSLLFVAKIVAKIARKESLQMKLSQRPDKQELIDKNIIPIMSENERHDCREAIGTKLNRRLSLRPTQEELEQRNILNQLSPDEMKQEKEKTRQTLIRKVCFLYSQMSKLILIFIYFLLVTIFKIAELSSDIGRIERA